MPNPENLKPCKPGETANPNGRPKGSRNFKTVLREMLAGLDPDKDWGNPLAKQLIKLAFSIHTKDTDKLKALKEILDRLEGKPMQPIEQTDKKDIKIIFPSDKLKDA